MSQVGRFRGNAGVNSMYLPCPNLGSDCCASCSLPRAQGPPQRPAVHTTTTTTTTTPSEPVPTRPFSEPDSRAEPQTQRASYHMHVFQFDLISLALFALSLMPVVVRLLSLHSGPDPTHFPRRRYCARKSTAPVPQDLLELAVGRSPQSRAMCRVLLFAVQLWPRRGDLGCPLNL